MWVILIILLWVRTRENVEKREYKINNEVLRYVLNHTQNVENQYIPIERSLNFKIEFSTIILKT